MQRLHIDRRSGMMPVAEKKSSFAPFLFSFGNKKVNKIFAIVKMNNAIRFQTKMYICADRSFFK
jgi:hypothetical protein